MSTVVVATAGYVIARAWHQRRSRRRRWTITAVMTCCASAAIVPILGVMVPGRPDATGILTAVGDRMPVPPAARGSVRLLIGAEPVTRDGTVTVELTGPDVTVVASIHRQHVAARSSLAHVEATAPSVYTSATLTPGTVHLELTNIDPERAGPVTVSIYRVVLGRGWLLAIYLLTLGFVLVTESHLGSGSGVGASGAAITIYALYVRAAATPTNALTPALIALLPSALLGVVVNMAAMYVARKSKLVRLRGGLGSPGSPRRRKRGGKR